MKKLILSMLIVLVASPLLFAQDNRTDFFLGYSSVHNGDFPKHISFVPVVSALRSGVWLNGATGEVTVNAKSWFGLNGDLSFSRGGKENLFLILGGPELSLRKSQFRVFAHALVGGAYVTQKLSGFRITALADSSFAYALGGGWDLYPGKSKHVGFRVVQADYFYTDAFSGSENNVRVSTGLVFR